jgi:hypothetical protein
MIAAVVERCAGIDVGKKSISAYGPEIQFDSNNADDGRLPIRP